MAELRITWADLLKRRACVEAKPFFDRAVANQGHGEPDVLIFPNGWGEQNVKNCMALPGGAYWLHFLEALELVPVIESKCKIFPRELVPLRKALAIKLERKRQEAVNAIRP